ncbi:hypothetical protein AB1Y20_021065 [Prymnesium parvum]|uniref:Beach domain-containing protein n=1 Tax=Prymnesium parvum TaxID=97485 RepID=A0AB34JHA0_PRYPA
MAHISVHDTVTLAAEAVELEHLALDPRKQQEVLLLCRKLTALVELDPDASVVLGGVGLVKGIATLLKPLCDDALQADGGALAAVGEPIIRLLALLLRADSNAAVLHVRGDAALLARLAQRRAPRGIRRAATIALQNMSAGECAVAERAQTIALLLQTLELSVARVGARLAAAGGADDTADASWGAALTLSALWHAMDGSYMAFGASTRAEPAAGRAAADESLGGAACVGALIGALRHAFTADPADEVADGVAALSLSPPLGVQLRLLAAGPRRVLLSLHPTPPPPRGGRAAAGARLAEAGWLLVAALRTLGGAMSRGGGGAAACWRALGGAAGLEALLRRCGVMGSGCSPLAVDALLQMASPPRGEAQPRCALVALALLPSVRRCGEAWRLVRALHAAAAASEAEAVGLARCGVAAKALELAEAAEAAAGGAGEAPLWASLLQLGARLCRAWAGTEELLLLLRGATRRLAAADSPWLAALATATAPPALPLCLPYVWLRPPHGHLQLQLQGRAWPPSNGYSFACWLRAADGDGEAGGAPFTLFDVETSDARSFLAATLSRGSLAVHSGSRAAGLRPAARRVALPRRGGRWWHLAVTHERRRPLHASQLAVYVDGQPHALTTLAYPPLDCQHDGVYRQGYLPHAPPLDGGGGGGDDDDDAAEPPAEGRGAPSAGWHVGPCFACELALAPPAVRHAFSWGLGAPWVRLERADGGDDVLQPWRRLCWRQCGLEAMLREEGGLSRAPPLADFDEAADEEAEARLPLAKTVFAYDAAAALPAEALSPPAHADEAWLLNLPSAAAAEHAAAKVDGAAAFFAGNVLRCRGGVLVEPRLAAAALPAAGGPSEIVQMVRLVPDSASLLRVLRVLRQCLVMQPANNQLAEHEASLVELAATLRTRPALLTDAACDALLALAMNVPLAAAAAAAPAAAEELGVGGVVADVRVLRDVLLDARLWGAAAEGVQRHWLLALLALLSEDSCGAWNAYCLMRAGVLDCMFALLQDGKLVPSGAHLLATRLSLRVWHSVHISDNSTQRLAVGMEEEQLLCLRVLLRMLGHASDLLAAHARAPLPHAGARAVLSLLQPPLLLLFLQPSSPPRAVLLSLRLIGALLHLSRRFPAAVDFAAAFRDAMGYERLAVLLPLHAHVPDVYLTLATLAFGHAPRSLEAAPPPDSPAALHAACAQLLERGRPTVLAAGRDLCHTREGVGLTCVVVREGLRICAAAGAKDGTPPADGEAPPAKVHLVLRLLGAVLPLLCAVSDDAERLAGALLPHGEAVEQLRSAVGVAWLYADAFAAAAAGGGVGVGEGVPSGDEVLQPLVLLVQRAVLVAPQAPRVLLSGGGGGGSRPPPLDSLLSPLPSLAHSGLRFAAWLAVRARLVCRVVDGLHADLWARGADAPLPDASLAAIGRLAHAAVQLHAYAVLPRAGGADVRLPHGPLLALLMQLLETSRGKPDATLLQTGAAAAGAAVQSGAAAVSSLVSWVSRRAAGGAPPPPAAAEAAAPRARRLLSRASGELEELSLRLLLLRLSDPQASGEALVALLGELSMALATLSSRGAAREALLPHRALLCALCWRLFLLLQHAHADVRTGALQRWLGLMAYAPLRLDAFEGSPLADELEALLAAEAGGGAFWLWLDENRAAAAPRLDGTLGAAWRGEEARAAADAARLEACHAAEEARKAEGELAWLHGAARVLEEGTARVQAEVHAARRAHARRLLGARRAARAQCRRAERQLVLAAQRRALEDSLHACVRREAAAEGSALRAACEWLVDGGGGGGGGVRRKLQRDGAAAAAAAAHVAAAFAPAEERAPRGAPTRISLPDEALRAPRAFGGGGEGTRRLASILDGAAAAGEVYDVWRVVGLDAVPAVLALTTTHLYLALNCRVAAADADGAPLCARVAAEAAAAAAAGRGGGALASGAAHEVDAAHAWAYVHSESEYAAWPLAELCEPIRRRYQLQPSAVQLPLRGGGALFLALARGEAARDALYARLQPLLAASAEERERRQSEEARPPLFGAAESLAQLTEAWVDGRASSFDYLLRLNFLAGRWYDDLMQYPVFPWLLRDHESESLQLTSASSFRDLAWPMGAQTPGRADQFRQRHDEWDDEGVDGKGKDGVRRFHYGTHYSSAASVSSYLLRLQPFTDYHLALQGGRFDLADRLFHSVGEEWQLASGERGSDTGCVKELIPELYYLPEALLNVNHLSLGARQDGALLSHVALPRWARGSAWRFVRLMRAALECAHVSRALPGWIDLIFGYKQQGDAAVAALNVFYYCTYADAVDLSALPHERAEAVLSQIQHFGQTPQQLWRHHAHPRRADAAARAGATASSAPLLATLLAAHTLRPAAEPASAAGQPVRTLLASHDRCAALSSRGCAFPRSALLLTWGHADGSLRALHARAPAAPPAFCWDGMHAGEPIVACCVAADGLQLATADGSGLIAVWQTSVERGGTPRLRRRRGQLRGHTRAVRELACAASHHELASVCAGGLLLVWDLRLLLLLHAVDVCRPPTARGGVPAAAAEVVGVCVKEETGEIFVLTTQQLQLWSCNGALLAASADAFPPATSLVPAPTPEWMVEQLPLALTGHADGSIRWWVVREPTTSACRLPAPISRLPVASHMLPVWQLAERRDIRLQGSKAGVAVTALSLGGEQRARALGAAPEKLLFSGDAQGNVLSWKSSAPDSGLDGLPRVPGA